MGNQMALSDSLMPQKNPGSEDPGYSNGTSGGGLL